MLLDPTSMVFDENTNSHRTSAFGAPGGPGGSSSNNGYSTPSYAGSYADDSSFDDRRSASPFFVPSPNLQDVTLDTTSGSINNSNAFLASAHHIQQQSYSTAPSPSATSLNMPPPLLGDNQTFFGSADDLLAFREKYTNLQPGQQDGRFGTMQAGAMHDNWETASSLAGSAVNGQEGENGSRVPPGIRSTPGSVYEGQAGTGGEGELNNLRSNPAMQSSPDLNNLVLKDDDPNLKCEDTALEMSAERMFAPLPSPNLFPARDRESTLRAGHTTATGTVRGDTSSSRRQSHDVSSTDASQNPSTSSRGNDKSEGLFTASPADSPTLLSQDKGADVEPLGIPMSLPAIVSQPPTATQPQFDLSGPAGGTNSPPPSTQQPQFRMTERKASLRSPPLTNVDSPGSAGSGSGGAAKTSSLAPLAIPEKPDLTLTTATPTAIPRTATQRQDSTQAALDTVFSTFFDKRNSRLASPRTATQRQDSTQATLDSVFETFFDKKRTVSAVVRI